ncbi:LysE family translocator [Hyphomonas sp.]|uniref:LysE family translocator n=1 Tax=Hyphomonas sp. TaxID=87 RepID=UPI0025BCEC87|nr:LysE family translocator [Hyphomonas sp.]MBI1399786.1 LysE family translocator [Hyphomonas sp.]
MLASIDWVGFMFAMVVVELTPGPNMGWLAALSMREGRKAGFAAVAGITLGLSLQLLAAITGLAALVAAAPSVFTLLHWAGVAFMLYLACEAFMDGRSAVPANMDAARGFVRGVIANVLNPKALVFYVLLIGQFIDASDGPVWLQSLILGLIHLTIAATVHIFIVLLADSLGARLETWRTSLAARLLFAGLLTGIAIWIALTPMRV